MIRQPKTERQQRLAHKHLEQLALRQLREDFECSPFESRAILEAMRTTFELSWEGPERLKPGQLCVLAAEAQLQKIMDSTVKVDDVLAVYNQLVYTREQIEVVKGQMKYYSEAAAMSLVSIDLIPDALSQPIDVGGWKPEGVAKEAIEALIDAAQGLAELAIWGALYCLPLVLVFGLPAFFIGRWGWRKLRRPKPQPPAQA